MLQVSFTVSLKWPTKSYLLYILSSYSLHNSSEQNLRIVWAGNQALQSLYYKRPLPLLQAADTVRLRQNLICPAYQFLSAQWEASANLLNVRNLWTVVPLEVIQILVDCFIDSKDVNHILAGAHDIANFYKAYIFQSTIDLKICFHFCFFFFNFWDKNYYKSIRIVRKLFHNRMGYRIHVKMKTSNWQLQSTMTWTAHKIKCGLISPVFPQIVNASLDGSSFDKGGSNKSCCRSLRCGRQFLDWPYTRQ